MNYKNVHTGEVISSDCYNKLPHEKKLQYRYVSDPVTHKVSNGDDFLLTALLIGSMMDSGSESNSPSSGHDFGGGSFGGGGASGDWGSNSSDSGSSSSSDSGSSSSSD